MIANVYVDGFNLYNGALKRTGYKWLDLSLLVNAVVPGYTINRIRYYTALVSPTPTDPHNIARQRQYLRALQTIPNLSIHRGHFLRHSVMRPLGEPPGSITRPILVKVIDNRLTPPQPVSLPLAPYSGESPLCFVPIVNIEEKGSDVNMATHLLWNAVQGEYDAAIIVSNDSDLLEPIRIAQQELGKQIVIINPHKDRPSVELKRIANKFRDIRAGHLSASQFPPEMSDSRGSFSKPTAW